MLLNPPTQDNKKFIREGRCTQEQGVWATLWPPVSLATIGAVLEHDGHDGAGYRLRCSRHTLERAGSGDSAVLRRGSSSGAPAPRPSIMILSLAAFIKEIDPAITTAVFGTHVTALDRQCLEQFPALDVIIRNEPEHDGPGACAFSAGWHSPTPASPGVTARAATGEIIAEPAAPLY